MKYLLLILLICLPAYSQELYLDPISGKTVFGEWEDDNTFFDYSGGGLMLGDRENNLIYPNPGESQPQFLYPLGGEND